MDLHVHSPASSDYMGDKHVSPYEFVSRFVNRGFDLIVITDHNTGAYIDRAVAARDEIAEAEGKNIAILPGVELYVSPGIHLLVILPGGGSAAITDLLSRLGLPVEQHGDITKLISESIGEISRIVHQRGGMLIGAHCNSSKGIIEELRGQPRIEWVRAMDALEINCATGDEKVTKTINYVTKALRIPIPFTFGSDSHDCSSANVGMWVKMAEPSYMCLRQFIFEPELRISRDKPNVTSHGRIVGFSATLGVYENESFRFSPNLNVILGGRGAGKSAAIDLLRFAFEAEPRAGDDNSRVFAGRIMGFLQSVGEVLVVVVGGDGETYAITRSGTYQKRSAQAVATFTETARVYQVIGDNLIRREMRPLDVLGIEFYGQGEAARLADRVDKQLRLIDENLDHSEHTASINDAEQQLTSDEKLLIKHKTRLEVLLVEAAALPGLEERRNHLAKSLKDPIFAERTRWDRERSWMQRQQDWTQNSLDTLPASIPSLPEMAIDLEGSSVKAVLEKVLEASNRVFAGGQKDLARIRQRLESAASELESYRAEWESAFEAAEEQFRAGLAKLGATNLAQIAAEQRTVEEELARIETDVKPEIQWVKSEIASLESQRATIMGKLREARTAIAKSRSDFVLDLNEQLGGNVTVDLTACDLSLFFAVINSALQGSGMQRREEQVSLVCESFTPEKFVEIIRAASRDQLMANGITENSASRMISTLTDDILYEIERVDVPQLPSIRIKREGEAVFTDLASLSVGEKCSAILSIALLSKGKPLVIDQPEDDLDHAFIIDSIVEGIRIAKSSRQIIAATHNPNIPVLGDAEMVFRVARRVGYDICHIQNSGGLELPNVTAEVQGLEGGADAFERRRQRYSIYH